MIFLDLPEISLILVEIYSHKEVPPKRNKATGKPVALSFFIVYL